MSYVIITVSVLINILLIWYIIALLRKFMFISSSLSDLFLMMRAFQIFIKSLYGMDNYHGEPMIQEMIFRIKEVVTEIENFRDIFEPTLDDELEEELDESEEEEASISH